VSNTITWYEDENIKLFLEPHGDMAFVHVTVLRFTKEILKFGLSLLQEIELEMGKLGFKHLLMYNPKQTEKWDKFMTHFIKYPILFYMDNGHHVYGKELAWA